MNEMFWKAFDQWNTVKDSNVSSANDLLLVLMRHVFETTPKLDLQTLDRIRLQMEYALEDERPDSLKSYNLGMARTLTYFLQHEIQGKQQEVTLNGLPNLERKLIAAIGAREQSTPTQLAKDVGIDNPQHRSNLLRSLRAKDLVQYMGIGKNRFYSLTRTGVQVFEQLRARGETSTAVESRVSVKNRVIFSELVKPPKSDKPQRQHNNRKSDEEWLDEFPMPSTGWPVNRVQKEMEQIEMLEGVYP